MLKPNRNDPCPCGSGKKFKKCHLGKESELQFLEPDEFSEEMSRKITSLPVISYGRCAEFLEGIDIKELTGSSSGIKFVDLKAYSDLSFLGSKMPEEGKVGGGSIFINIYKTQKSDPDNIYIAISPNIGDSTLIHQIAHALDYLKGSKLMPGSGKPLSMELEIPVEHLEHAQEYGYWLDYLQKKFEVKLDADDSIIHYLYKNEKLIRAENINYQDNTLLKVKSNQMLEFLSQHGEEINEIIRERAGYIGKQEQKD